MELEERRQELELELDESQWVLGLQTDESPPMMEGLLARLEARGFGLTPPCSSAETRTKIEAAAARTEVNNCIFIRVGSG